MDNLTDRQKEVLEAYNKAGSHRKAAEMLGCSRNAIAQSLNQIKTKSLKGQGTLTPTLTPCEPGFSTKRISTARREDGSIALQWHIQEPEKASLEEIQDHLLDVFSSIKPCKPLPQPKKTLSDLASCYIIGDHHLGMTACSEETGQDWDLEKSEQILIESTQKLVARSPESNTGYLINLGDFLHADDKTNRTPRSGHALDSEHFCKVARRAGILQKTLVELMLQKHKKVEVINVRGNHDPNSGMWLNEVLRAYFLNNKRVNIPQNFHKFLWFTWGKNLVVTHHGDGINWARMHQSVVSNLSKEWGESDYRFGWTGHLHHEESKEIGGMKFERFGVLPPPDAWHSGEGYGSQRSMTCIVLHKTQGLDTRYQVTV